MGETLTQNKSLKPLHYTSVYDIIYVASGNRYTFCVACLCRDTTRPIYGTQFLPQ